MTDEAPLNSQFYGFTNTYDTEEQAKYAVDYYNDHGFKATRDGKRVKVDAERKPRNDLESEMLTPPLLKDQFLNVLKAGFENMGDAENAKLYRFLRQLQLARESEKVSKEEQKLYEDMTRLCDEATKLPMGSGEEAITNVWFKADNRSRRILYSAMVELADRFGWDFDRSQALLELQRGKRA